MGARRHGRITPSTAASSTSAAWRSCAAVTWLWISVVVFDDACLSTLSIILSKSGTFPDLFALYQDLGPVEPAP